MKNTATVHGHPDEGIKTQAAKQQRPFAPKVPNAQTRAAMAEADEIVRQHRARFANADELFDALEKNSRK